MANTSNKPRNTTVTYYPAFAKAYVHAQANSQVLYTATGTFGAAVAAAVAWAANNGVTITSITQVTAQ